MLGPPQKKVIEIKLRDYLSMSAIDGILGNLRRPLPVLSSPAENMSYVHLLAANANHDIPFFRLYPRIEATSMTRRKRKETPEISPTSRSHVLMRDLYWPSRQANYNFPPPQFRIATWACSLSFNHNHHPHQQKAFLLLLLIRLHRFPFCCILWHTIIVFAPIGMPVCLAVKKKSLQWEIRVEPPPPLPLREWELGGRGKLL